MECVVQFVPALLSVSLTEEERNRERRERERRDRSLALSLQIDAAIMHTVKLLIIASVSWRASALGPQIVLLCLECLKMNLLMFCSARWFFMLMLAKNSLALSTGLL